jgi:hypothetical protein
MINKTFLKDAEASVYALECAVCLVISIASADYAQAAVDFVGLVGWAFNSFDT